MKFNFWYIILGFWILFALFVGYAYFFNPSLFNQMFGIYKGPGSPYINAP